MACLQKSLRSVRGEMHRFVIEFSGLLILPEKVVCDNEMAVPKSTERQ